MPALLDSLLRYMDSVRMYLFYYPEGMVNNPAQFALLLALILIFFDDIKRSSVVWGIIGGIILIFMSTKELHILSMPFLSAYVTFRAAERYEGRRQYAVVAAGFLVFLLACSFDGLFGTAV